MTVHTWNDKIVYCDDGYGYRVSEGDEGEVIIYHFEVHATGKTEKEEMRLYVGEVGDALLEALRDKFHEIGSR